MGHALQSPQPLPGFLRAFRTLFDSEQVSIFWDEANGEFSRIHAGGVVTLVGEVRGLRLGVIVCDFRVNGGSFGKENSTRITEFVRAMEREGTPILFQLQTLGVRIMEGRTVFAKAFGVLPALARFAESNLLITSVNGQCLGLGALIFSLGHYRLAVAGKTLNLTGPEVFEMFFGKAVDFEHVAAVERQLEKTELVQEIQPSDVALYERVRAIVGFTGYAAEPATSDAERESSVDLKADSLLRAVGNEAHEVLTSMNKVVRAYVVKRGGRAVGVLMNPPGNPNNMFNVQTLQKYCAALDLFAALRVPVISFVDTPGADPRVDGKNADIVGALVSLAKRIMKYRFGLMGVVVGRCFGGASIVAFPKSFGGTRVVAVRGSTIGIMDQRIVSKLLANTPRLLAQWDEACAAQSPDCADMIEEGIIDEMVERDDVDLAVNTFFEEAQVAATSVRHLRMAPQRTSSRHVAVPLAANAANAKEG